MVRVVSQATSSYTDMSLSREMVFCTTRGIGCLQCFMYRNNLASWQMSSTTYGVSWFENYRSDGGMRSLPLPRTSPYRKLTANEYRYLNYSCVLPLKRFKVYRLGSTSRKKKHFCCAISTPRVTMTFELFMRQRPVVYRARWRRVRRTTSPLTRFLRLNTTSVNPTTSSQHPGEPLETLILRSHYPPHRSPSRRAAGCAIAIPETATH